MVRPMHNVDSVRTIQFYTFEVEGQERKGIGQEYYRTLFGSLLSARPCVDGAVAHLWHFHYGLHRTG